MCRSLVVLVRVVLTQLLSSRKSGREINILPTHRKRNDVKVIDKGPPTWLALVNWLLY